MLFATWSSRFWFVCREVSTTTPSTLERFPPISLTFVLLEVNAYYASKEAYQNLKRILKAVRTKYHEYKIRKSTPNNHHMVSLKLNADRSKKINIEGHPKQNLSEANSKNPTAKAEEADSPKKLLIKRIQTRPKLGAQSQEISQWRVPSARSLSKNVPKKQADESESTARQVTLASCLTGHKD